MNAALFWNIVKHEVEKQHTSFEWLSRKTGISKGTVSSWKSRSIIPRADDAYKIAKALGVSVEYLLTGADSDTHVSNPDITKIIETIAQLDSTDITAIKALSFSLANRYAKASAQ